MFVVYFPEQCIDGRPFYSKENASALNFAVQKDDKFTAYSTSLFFLPVHIFVSFLEQYFAGKRFYSKEIASAQNFAVQVDDIFAAYSTSLFYPPVHVCCVFS